MSIAADSGVWVPPPGTTWQWQLSGDIDLSFDVEMYDVDLFEIPDETIDGLHGDGRVVICYFSAGSVEEWRPDAALFTPDVVGEPLDGWPGERWLDVTRHDVLAPIMERRLDLALAKGCDGVEPDNVDGYSNVTGFDLQPSDQLAFNLWLATAAHERGLSIGLKNDLGQVPDLVDAFDWVLVEQCVEFDECGGVEHFVSAGKAAFAAEYGGPSLAACDAAAQSSLSLIFKDLELSAATVVCE
jgi:hypothetical protein